MAKDHRSTTASFSQESLSIHRVALYARVSTINGQDPEMQLRELREYCSRRGWPVPAEYVDKAYLARKIPSRTKPIDVRRA